MVLTLLLLWSEANKLSLCDEVRRFPSHDVCLEMRHLLCGRIAECEARLVIESVPGNRMVWHNRLTAARSEYETWDKLDDCWRMVRWMSGEWWPYESERRLAEHLSALRVRLGEEAYVAGEMPFTR